VGRERCTACAASPPPEDPRASLSEPRFVDFAVRGIEYPSRLGENVADFFGGSGSTLITCEKSGRRCFMMELDPLYRDILVQRWGPFTGKKASR
jgi:DNA modification methylase